MIRGDLRVIERDGDRVVGDAEGHEIVIRRASWIGGYRRYHRIDAEQFEEDGTLAPACDHNHTEDAQYLPRCRRDIESHWTGCSYRGCYGEYVLGKDSAEGPSLAVLLEEMSVEEFDNRVSATGDSHE